MNHRVLRINNLVHEELAKLLVREVDFRGALATITEVVTTDEIDYAVVRISVIPSDRAEDVLRTLTKATSHLQYLLIRKINIRPMPKIRFELDRGPEKAAEMEKMMSKIEKEINKEE